MKGLGIVVKTTDEQEKRLERLLPWHQKHVEEDGSYPHSNWNESDMLECLVNIHANELVEFLLSEEERRQGIIPERKRARHKSLTLNRIRICDKISIRHTAEKVKFYKGLAAV